MRIEQATTETILDLRRRALRPHLPVEASIYPEEAKAIHFALYLPGTLGANTPISIVTAHPEALPGSSPSGSNPGEPNPGEAVHWRIRGMATEPTHINQGHGSKVLKALLDWGQAQGIPLFWCNARERAVPFYERFGFQTCSELFEIPSIGMHKRMKLEL